MPQDFYVKLPFYVTEGTVPRYVSVSFGGETVIPKTEIVSRDMRNPDILTFNVSKEPGIYDMVISIPDHSFEENGAVILKHFYISPDNVVWYHNVVLGRNTNGSNVITLSQEELVAPHLATICGFWFGNSVPFELEIPDDWAVRYLNKTIEEAIAMCDSVLTDPTTSEEARAVFQERRDKLSTILILTED
jgi:hypothetical protein